MKSSSENLDDSQDHDDEDEKVHRSLEPQPNHDQLHHDNVRDHGAIDIVGRQQHQQAQQRYLAELAAISAENDDLDIMEKHCRVVQKLEEEEENARVAALQHVDEVAHADEDQDLLRLQHEAHRLLAEQEERETSNRAAVRRKVHRPAFQEPHQWKHSPRDVNLYGVQHGGRQSHQEDEQDA